METTLYFQNINQTKKNVKLSQKFPFTLQTLQIQQILNNIFVCSGYKTLIKEEIGWNVFTLTYVFMILFLYSQTLTFFFICIKSCNADWCICQSLFLFFFNNGLGSWFRQLCVWVNGKWRIVLCSLICNLSLYLVTLPTYGMHRFI